MKDTNEEIVKQLQALNTKMDILIKSITQANLDKTINNSKYSPYTTNIPEMPNFSKPPDIENIKKTVEERIRQARAAAEAKISKIKENGQEDIND